LIISLQDIQTY